MFGAVVDQELARKLRRAGIGALLEAQARRDGVMLDPDIKSYLDELAIMALGSNDTADTAQPQPIEVEWLSTAEAAERLGTNDRMVRRMIGRQDLVSRRRGRCLEVTADSVDDARVMGSGRSGRVADVPDSDFG